MPHLHTPKPRIYTYTLIFERVNLLKIGSNMDKVTRSNKVEKQCYKAQVRINEMYISNVVCGRMRQDASSVCILLRKIQEL